LRLELGEFIGSNPDIKLKPSPADARIRQILNETKRQTMSGGGC
jgi:hypothetical protein